MARYKCEHCGKEFSSYDGLRQHHSGKHPQLQLAVAPKRSRRQLILASVAIAIVGSSLGFYFQGGSLLGTNYETIGALGSAHIHERIALYLDNQQIDLSQQQFQLRDKYAHFEGGDGTTLHLHATGITLRYAIGTLGISYDSEKTVVVVSGQQRSEGLSYKPVDGDEISVWLFSPRLVIEGLSIGNLAPDFTLIDPEGRTVTRDSLKGKPTFIFFTTTWCVPCQVGAKELQRYDLETGDDAFNVVIVFLNVEVPGYAKDTNETVKHWKDSFGGKDSFTALDTTGMVQTYQVRYLDTKYVLDGNGIIRWTDVYPLRYETAKSVLEPLIR